MEFPAGLTTVLPAAIAGPIPQPQSRNGKFHGTINRTAPQALHHRGLVTGHRNGGVE